MRLFLYVFIKFPIGLCLALLGWPLVMTVVGAPIGAPMIGAGMLLMFPNRRKTVRVIHKHERER